MSWFRRHPTATAYLLLAPGIAYLAVFYLYPTLQMFLVSLWTGTAEGGYQLTFDFGIYPRAVAQYSDHFLRSLLYGGIATLLTFAIGFPLAYFIAFRGGRYKSLLLFLVIAPF
ncbi:MAG: ABC transporter permease, partial [Chloroflexota bacterium]|nr:ABC transporter permease [Chloroflexota bacterium]